MCPAWAFVALAGIFALTKAGQDSGPVRTARGGFVTTTGHYQFEVYFYPTGVRVFPQRPAGTPLAVSRIAGTVTFYHPNSPEPWFSRPLRSAPSASSLDLAIGLGDVPAVGVKVTIAVDGLPEPSEPTATFTVPLEFVAKPASGGIVASTRPARPRGGIPPLYRSADGLGYLGLGDYLPPRHDLTLPLTIAPQVSLRGYGPSRPPAPKGLCPL